MPDPPRSERPRRGEQPPQQTAATSEVGVGGSSAVPNAYRAGDPFIPAQRDDSPPLGVAGSGSGPAPSNEELIIEVELAPGMANIGFSLTLNTADFLAGIGGAAHPQAALGSVLRRFGLRDVRPVFTRAQVQADEARTSALREAATMGAAPPDQASALERLPSLSNFVRLRFPPGTPAAEVTAALKRLPEVARAVPVPQAMPPMAIPAPIPSDPLIGSGSGPLFADPVTSFEWQWYLHRTRVPQAWRYARGANVVVADIDWGYRTTHEELQGAIERTYNAVDGGNDVTHGSYAAHGTAVMGIAGARANGAGIAGYAPEATLWAIQGNSAPNPPVFEEPWAEAIDYVRRTDSGNRRKVIILEVQTGAGGNYEQIPSVHRAIRAAIADGCVVCVAAGNGNRAADRTDTNEPFDPTGSILVGATAYHEHLNKRAWFSNYGSRVVVAAPGDSLHDLTSGQAANNAYRNDFGGTSGATPKVAGTVALMLSVNPNLSHDDVRDILAGTGSALTQDPGKPVGVLVNAEAAVAEALRRLSEANPPVSPLETGAPRVPERKSLHGVRRRMSQTVLPQETEGPVSWDDAQEPVDPALAAAGLPPGEQPPAGDKLLRVFRESVEGTLTQQDRILIVAQAIQMLDNFYVHRALKEALHGVRPIQRLRVVLRRLQQQTDIPVEEQDELEFHNTLTQIFNSVRDLHTSYQLPRPFRDYIVYLPFEVASFHEDDQRRYLVTRVMPGYTFADPNFGPGSEVLYWNGMAIDRAVRANADQTAGSNEAARHARGMSALTIRPLNTALPPDADFVDMEFVGRGADLNDPAARRRMRQQWFVRYAPTTIGGVEALAAGRFAPAPAPAAPVPGGTPPTPSAITVAVQNSVDLGRESTARSSKLIFEDTPPSPAPAASPIPLAESESAIRDLSRAASLGLDTAADAVREARQLIFESSALRELQRANVGDERVGIRGSASPESVNDTVMGTEITVKVPWNAAFRARTVDIGGVTYGHIHIRTFHVEDADGFVGEFIRLLEQMPETGVILDVRGNGGGNIWAAERLIQTLTATEIEPERMQFIVTQGTLDLCRNNPAESQIPLHKWRSSLEDAVETGSVYSHAFPLTSEESCNAIGQTYYGPVVLIVDGNCYSATDIFAAGFQDHHVGKILGVSTTTGAGGANVWEHWLLNETLPAGWGLKPLPNQAGMRVAIRQCLRVTGALLEDFGVVPDHVHPPTRADVMEGDRMLLASAAELLAPASARSLKVTMGAPNATKPGFRRVTVATRGLKRLDLFVDNRPEGSLNLDVSATGEATLTPSIAMGAKLRLTGYANLGDGEPVALYRGQVP